MGEACSFAVTPTPLDIDGNIFPAFVSPPQSSKPPLFLAGAGVRGLDIGGQFVKFSAIGVYLEHSAIETLSRKWSGKAPDELAASLEFYSDIFNGPFEKFVRVTLIRHLTGEQYTGKVIENCIAIWKGYGIFTQEQVDAANKLKEVFKPEDFPPGTSILFTHSPSGALSIAFSEDSSVPETNKAVIENKALCNGVLDSIIGENGVSPAAKRSLAIRVREHFIKSQSNANQPEEEEELNNPVAVNA